MKIVLVGGAGGVGASIAFNLLIGANGFDVVLVDRRRNMVTSHVMDLEQVIQLGGSGRIRGGEDREVLDADVVVISASVPLRLNDSRSIFLKDNIAGLSDVADLLATAGSSWRGVLIVVTNPVDALCTWLARHSKLDRQRVIGYVLNDSLRLRLGLSYALEVEPQNVEAWAIGEHGAHCVPLFSRVKVGDRPVSVTLEQRKSAEEFVRSWYLRHVALDSGRTTTWTSGLGVAQMVRGITNPKQEVWPASVMLEGEYGISGVSVGVPVQLGPRGVERIHQWSLSPEEQVSLVDAAEYIESETSIAPGL